MTVNFLYGEFAFSVIYLVHVYLDSWAINIVTSKNNCNVWDYVKYFMFVPFCVDVPEHQKNK